MIELHQDPQSWRKADRRRKDLMMMTVPGPMRNGTKYQLTICLPFRSCVAATYLQVRAGFRIDGDSTVMNPD